MAGATFRERDGDLFQLQAGLGHAEVHLHLERIAKRPDEREIAQKLGIPDNLKIGVAVGEPYVWEAAGIRIADVSFYLGDTFIAGAECEVHTSNLARSIYKYEY